MVEIGSEYWYEEVKSYKFKKIEKNFDIGKDNQLLFSGRTAIDYVLDEITINKTIKKVYFPDYCCESMIQPFLDKNIEVIYYKVFYDKQIKYEINTNEDCDIFFAMNYFGYTSTNMDKYIQKFRKRGKIVIEDITHSLLSEKVCSQNSNYLVGSLRKWFPIISGGIAVNLDSNFIEKDLKEVDESFVSLKKSAMEKKSEYLKNGCIDQELKKIFLDEYNKSNEMIKNNFRKYKIDKESRRILEEIDINEIKRKRKNNAKLIHEKLKSLDNIKFLIKDINFEKDCPLFVPILVKDKEEFKNYLVKNNIFCPTHWPIPKYIIRNTSNIYNNEVSLICDQRYNETQINEYLKKIKIYKGAK